MNSFKQIKTVLSNFQQLLTTINIIYDRLKLCTLFLGWFYLHDRFLYIGILLCFYRWLWKYIYKESPYPPGKEFSRSLESRFMVPKNEAQCSHFRSMGPFSWDMSNFISNILYFVKKMMSLLLTITWQVFKIKKRFVKKIVVFQEIISSRRWL